MVGTAHRAAQLLAATHKGALRASALRLVLVDATPNAKAFTMLTQPEASAALRELLEAHPSLRLELLPRTGKAHGREQAALFRVIGV